MINNQFLNENIKLIHLIGSIKEQIYQNIIEHLNKRVVSQLSDIFCV